MYTFTNQMPINKKVRNRFQEISENSEKKNQEFLAFKFLAKIAGNNFYEFKFSIIFCSILLYQVI